MRKLSFKQKTAILITLLITFVCALCLTSVFTMSRYAADSKLEQLLIKSVERNVDEIEYKNGELDIEDDFAFYSDGVYCNVFSADLEYIAGEAPHALIYTENFANGETGKCVIEGEQYYTYDALLSFCKYEYEIDVFTGEVLSYEADTLTEKVTEDIDYSSPGLNVGIGAEKAIAAVFAHAGISKDEAKVMAAELFTGEERSVFRIEIAADKPLTENIWVRGIIFAEETSGVFAVMSRIIIYALPLFILLAGVGAYIIAKRTISPIEKISASAKAISSGNDLTRRVEIGDGSDEIHTLAKTVNDMLMRLQQSFENEKQFTSDASHELRTPLAVIKAECDYALSGKAAQSDITEAFASINEQTDKMTELVSALLMLTRAEQGKNRFRFEQQDLSVLCEVICADYVTQKGITLESEIESGIVMDIEPLLISRLLENLLSNAVKYGKENGSIFVRLYKNGSSVILSVKDDGIGIKPEEQARIFSRFYRAENARSGEGFGIGLSVVERIAALHSGKVTVSSVYGEGSVFTVTFSPE